MKVIEPKELEQRRHNRAHKQKSKRRKRRLLPFLLVITLLYSILVLLVPVPDLQTDTVKVSLPATTPVSLPWPSYGQAAIGAVGYGLLAQNGEQKSFPTASMAKVITAVAVLKARPMLAGEKGETITIMAEDVATYNAYIAQNQSVIKVEAGEQLTQYQALQALLLPSANNMADVLVRWAFGSQNEYLTFVNALVGTLGLENTHIDDASGFSPKTVSTATDITKLAEIAMNHPIISEIVGQPQADLPVAGTVYNVNRLVGRDGFVGIKTGNTDEAGGNYMFAVKRNIDSTNSVTVVGTVMGAPNLSTAIDDSRPIIDEAFKNFKVTTPITTRQAVGMISQTAGGNVPIVVRQGLQVVSWVAHTPRVEIVTNNLGSDVKLDDTVGNLLIRSGNMKYELPLAAGGTITPHSVLWRLRHAAGYL